MRLPLPFALERLIYEFASLGVEIVEARVRLKPPRWVVAYVDMCPWYIMRIDNTRTGSGLLYEL